MQEDSNHNYQNHHPPHQAPSLPSLPFIIELLDFITGKSFLIPETYGRGKAPKLIGSLFIMIKKACCDSLTLKYIILIENFFYIAHFPPIIRRTFGGKNFNYFSLYKF